LGFRVLSLRIRVYHYIMVLPVHQDVDGEALLAELQLFMDKSLEFMDSGVRI